MKVYRMTDKWPEDFRGTKSRYIKGYERPYCFCNGQYEVYIREKDIHDTKLFELVEEVEVVVLACLETRFDESDKAIPTKFTSNRHFEVFLKGVTATPEQIQEILSKHFNS